MTIKKILVATDFSGTSEAAAAYAFDLAQSLGASLTLMHAYEIPVGFPDGAFIASPITASELANTASTALAAVGDRYRGRGVPVECVLREGPVADTVNALADEMGADLVVIGTHGRRGLAHAILGSVAEHVIRSATRPVLTIHDRPKAAA